MWKAVVCAAALLVGCSSSHPAATPSTAGPSGPDMYVSALRQFAPTDTESDLLLIGNMVCSKIAGLGTPQALTVADYQNLVADAEANVPKDQAITEVTAAIRYLCPSYKRILPRG